MNFFKLSPPSKELAEKMMPTGGIPVGTSGTLRGTPLGTMGTFTVPHKCSHTMG